MGAEERESVQKHDERPENSTAWIMHCSLVHAKTNKHRRDNIKDCEYISHARESGTRAIERDVFGNTAASSFNLSANTGLRD